MAESLHRSSIAKAGANIALIKYWGKRGSSELNLPATGSISMTLEHLVTTTRVSGDPGLNEDQFVLNGQSVDDRRVCGFVAKVRQTCARDQAFCRIESENNFPTAAGLASSASGFGALVVALNEAWQLNWSMNEQALWARLGSGSAPRSLFGGFCRMYRGLADDGHDAVPRPLMDERAWPLEVVVAITQTRAKAVSSREGMRHTMATSPYYRAWVEHNEQRLDAAEAAILAKDFETLAELSEASALQMHASAMAAEPGVLYWNSASVACMQAIQDLRAHGVGVFFTMDAGPQVKAICLPGHSKQVADALTSLPGVESVIISALGPGAQLV